MSASCLAMISLFSVLAICGRKIPDMAVTFSKKLMNIKIAIPIKLLEECSLFDIHVSQNFPDDDGCNLHHDLLILWDFIMVHHVGKLLSILTSLQHTVGIERFMMLLGRWGSFVIGIDLAFNFSQPNQLMRKEDALGCKINQELFDELTLTTS